MDDATATARHAIEEVCSGRRPDELAQCYAPSFVDHVNVSEGDRVATHWTMSGTHRGWRVQLPGITISRFEDGRIVEDWSYSDSIEIAKQLGVWRSLLLVATEWRALFNRNSSA